MVKEPRRVDGNAARPDGALFRQFTGESIKKEAHYRSEPKGPTQLCGTASARANTRVLRERLLSFYEWSCPAPTAKIG